MTCRHLAEKAIEKQVAKSGAKLAVSQGAMVSIDTTGAVKAYVGGVDYADSQFDRAGTAKRQPGSTFKPFVYLAALEMGRTPEFGAQRCADQDRQMEAGKLRGQILRSGDPGDGACPLAQLGCGAVGDGDRAGSGH